MTLHHGDCIEVMATMEAESVDAIVTDPPYGLTFMGKDWDKLSGVPEHSGPQWGGYGWHGTGSTPPNIMQAWHERWAREVLRVAKPGAHLLAFGGTRTYHRLACAIEDAGWEIRDCLVWAYASGFPKSLDVSKAIDKAAGAERETTGQNGTGPRLKPGMGVSGLRVQGSPAGEYDGERAALIATSPATDAAKEWQGWGTALKPAWEPIVLARKPLIGTVAANVQRYGTGALNIDGTRIGGDSAAIRALGVEVDDGSGPGRWPANVVLTDPIFDGGVKGVVGGGGSCPEFPPGTSLRHHVDGTHSILDATSGRLLGRWPANVTDSGTYSRFFLIPKADRADREPVMGGPAERVVSVWGGDEDDLTPGKKSTIARRNHHPTVKPLDLMRHLVRLVTPPGGIVLDPFLGSGTTAIAAEMEGFAWVGIEKEAEYIAIAEARLNGVQKGLGLSA